MAFAQRGRLLRQGAPRTEKTGKRGGGSRQAQGSVVSADPGRAPSADGPEEATELGSASERNGRYSGGHADVADPIASRRAVSYTHRSVAMALILFARLPSPRRPPLPKEVSGVFGGEICYLRKAVRLPICPYVTQGEATPHSLVTPHASDS